jgi:hypothetical protein
MHGGREAAGDDRGIDPRAAAKINKELRKKYGL